jgi:hypothetical protein
MAESAWLRAASLVVGDGSAPLPDQAVRIENGLIAEVVAGRRAPSTAIEHRNATIAPGFIDVHVHLCFEVKADHDTARAFVVEASRDRLFATALRNARDCLRAGVTTVRDLGDRDRVVAGAVGGGAVVHRAARAIGGLPGREDPVADARLRQTLSGEHLGPVGVDVLGDGDEELIHGLWLGAVLRTDGELLLLTGLRGRTVQLRRADQRNQGEAGNDEQSRANQ